MKSWTWRTIKNKIWASKYFIVRMFFKRIEIEQFLSVTDIYVSGNTIMIEESIKLSPNDASYSAIQLSTIAIKE